MAFSGSVMNGNVEKRGNRIAFGGTVLVWGLLCTAGILVPLIPHAPVYKEVKITLAAAAPAHTEPAAAAAASQAAAPAPAAAVSSAKPAAKPAKPAAAAHKETVKKAAKPVTKTEPAPSYHIASSQPLAKSVDQILAEQSNTKTSKSSEWNDSAFSNTAASVSSSSSASAQTPVTQKVSDEDALRGSAGTGGKNSSAVSGGNMAGSRKGVAGGSASSGRAHALGKIGSATYTYTAGNGVSSNSSIKSSKGAGRVAIQMSDGSARALLDPAEPTIRISESNARLIDSTRKVTVTFTVLAAGNVPLSNIEITPAASLPPSVQLEIRSQIARWRFESSDTQGVATFEYTIVKK